MTQATSFVFLSLLLVAFGNASDTDLGSGIAAFNEGRYSVALARLRAATETSRGRVYLALTEAALNDCATALPVLEQYARGTSGDELPRLSGIAAAKCLSATGQGGEALTMAEGLKQRYPKDSDVLYLAAEMEMKAFNDTTYAMFERTPSSYRVHELSGRIFEIGNRFSDAVAEYQKAIELSPQSPDLHYRLGRAILLESHAPEGLQKASEAFRQELRISPEDSACEFQLGQIAQVRGDKAEAKLAFERALKQAPTFVTAMVSLARVYAQEKQFDRAISLLLRATDLQPKNEAAHYALLTAYRDNGQMDKARAEKTLLDGLQKPPEGEFNDFLKRLGDKQPAP